MTSKLITEFIGTFFLMATIILTVASGSLLAPVAIGSMLMVMVYMGGHISGAHYNPAVSLAAWMRGLMTQGDMIKYIAAQILAAVVASFVAMHLAGQLIVPSPAEGQMVGALVAEFLFTFALVLVILNVAATDETAGNSYFGLAIGFTVAAGAFAVGDISGGAFNPAVGLGPALTDAIMGDAGHLADVWLYLVGPFGGGAAGAWVYGLMNKPAS
ncbi:MAG: aquaporin [Rhodothermales bacterium]|nr:aquaporin [Rhodothermales bacterium]MBO6780969.1 aquaporin [Rhodothermales bacterium]